MKQKLVNTDTAGVGGLRWAAGDDGASCCCAGEVRSMAIEEVA
jgi:hypothetical protein